MAGKIATTDIKAGTLPNTVLAPTAPLGDNDTSIATTAFVKNFYDDNNATFTNDFVNTGTVQNPIIDLAVDPATKQNVLVSGTNIKTINGTSVLGSGDIVISGGGSQTPWTSNIDANSFNLSNVKQLNVKIPAVAGAATTWNPSDKNVNIILTNSNKTVNHNGNRGSVRSILGATTQKFYCEFKVITLDNSNQSFGVATSAMSLASWVGNVDAFGYSVWGYGFDKLNNGNYQPYFPGSFTLAVNDVIGMYFDGTAHTLGFTRNGVDMGIAYTGIPVDTYYAATGCFDNTNIIETNFGDTAFVYTPPSGFTSWNSGGTPEIISLETDAGGNTTIGGKLNLTTGYINSLMFNTIPTSTTVATINDIGKFTYDTNYIYICVGVNSWKRAALATW